MRCESQRWRRHCAWAAMLATLTSLLVVLFLYATLAEGRLATAAVWLTQVAIALGYSSLFKIGVTEPVLTISLLGFKRLLRALPLEMRQWIIEHVVEPFDRFASATA